MKICPKKVCLVFVDKNERNIILETDVDVSRTRTSFVEGQIRKGKIVGWFYCLINCNMVKPAHWLKGKTTNLYLTCEKSFD